MEHFRQNRASMGDRGDLPPCSRVPKASERVLRLRSRRMSKDLTGQVQRTTQLELELGARDQGGANTRKQRYLEATRDLLDEARAFYLRFFLAHAGKLTERVQVTGRKTGEVREALISADKLLSWAETHTVATREHPSPQPNWNFSSRFPDLPWEYRRYFEERRTQPDWQALSPQLVISATGAAIHFRKRLQVAADEPPASEPASGQDQSVRQGESLRAGSGHGRGQSLGHQSAL